MPSFTGNTSQNDPIRTDGAVTFKKNLEFLELLEVQGEFGDHRFYYIFYYSMPRISGKKHQNDLIRTE